MKTQSSSRPVSPLSASQWSMLEGQARNASDAVATLGSSLLLRASEAGADPEAQAVLLDLAKRVEDMRQSVLAGLPYMLHCQPEWTGGDSSDPKNHVLREPHVMGMRRHTVKDTVSKPSLTLDAIL